MTSADSSTVDMNVPFELIFYSCKWVDLGFSYGGGGAAKDHASAVHLTSAKAYGQGSGSAKRPGSFRFLDALSLMVSEPYLNLTFLIRKQDDKENLGARHMSGAPPHVHNIFRC